MVTLVPSALKNVVFSKGGWTKRLDPLVNPAENLLVKGSGGGAGLRIGWILRAVGLDCLRNTWPVWPVLKDCVLGNLPLLEMVWTRGRFLDTIPDIWLCRTDRPCCGTAGRDSSGLCMTGLLGCIMPWSLLLFCSCLVEADCTLPAVPLALIGWFKILWLLIGLLFKFLLLLIRRLFKFEFVAPFVGWLFKFTDLAVCWGTEAGLLALEPACLLTIPWMFEDTFLDCPRFSTGWDPFICKPGDLLTTSNTLPLLMFGICSFAVFCDAVRLLAITGSTRKPLGVCLRILDKRLLGIYMAVFDFGNLTGNVFILRTVFILLTGICLVSDAWGSLLLPFGFDTLTFFKFGWLLLTPPFRNCRLSNGITTLLACSSLFRSTFLLPSWATLVMMFSRLFPLCCWVVGCIFCLFFCGTLHFTLVLSTKGTATDSTVRSEIKTSVTTADLWIRATFDFECAFAVSKIICLPSLIHREWLDSD